MNIKTKDFAEVAAKIREAVGLDSTAVNLEVKAKGNSLFLNVTNREFYVSVKYELAEPTDFAATVDASLFLDLVSQITTEEFNIDLDGNALVITSGKSKYKLAMIYDNATLMTLPVIKINNKTVEMPISCDILNSILTVNSKEIAKIKNLAANELQRMYYVDETGCFTFTTGACINSFDLEKPVKLLLTEKIVKLFKLFKEDVTFSLGQDPTSNGTIRTKISLETPSVYLAAIITSDDNLIARAQQKVAQSKGFLSGTYENNVVLSAKEVSAAINRLMLYTKNSLDKPNMLEVVATATLDNDEFVIQDKFGNIETITVENGSYVDGPCSFKVNVVDIKLITDSCKDDHITMNCNNDGKVLVFARGNIINLIPKGK